MQDCFRGGCRDTTLSRLPFHCQPNPTATRSQPLTLTRTQSPSLTSPQSPAWPSASPTRAFTRGRLSRFIRHGRLVSFHVSVFLLPPGGF
jgi:hypothetical protein